MVSLREAIEDVLSDGGPPLAGPYGTGPAEVGANRRDPNDPARFRQSHDHQAELASGSGSTAARHDRLPTDVPF